MKKTILIIGLSFAVLGCSYAPKNDDTVFSISMINLISEPSKYIDKKISVIGYYNNVGYNLFLNEHSSENYDYASSVSVLSTKANQELLESCDLKFVVVEGTLKSRDSRVIITDITSMRLSKTGSDCQRRDID